MGNGERVGESMHKGPRHESKHFPGWRGALQVGDLRLVEDGNERNGNFTSDCVASETASERQDRKW